jgi:hypothetical protein
MKKVLSVVALICLLAGSAIGQAFEGQVIYERLMKSKSGELRETRRTEYLIKGNAVRLDHFENMQATAPLNTYIADKNGKLLAVAGGEKDRTATETRLEAIPASIWAQAKIEKTGNTKKILGQATYEMIVEINTVKITAWVTAIDFDYNQLLAPLNSAYEGLLPDNSKGLPLEVKVENMGIEAYTLRAIRFTPKTVDAGLFRLPAGLAVQKY